jgi:hypothetical protein
VEHDEGHLELAVELGALGWALVELSV